VARRPYELPDYRPPEWYREHLLDALDALGPSVASADVQKWLIERLRPLLSARDFETVNTGTSERWWQYVNGNRNRLKNEGLVYPTHRIRNAEYGYGSPQGVWELTEKGKLFVAERKAGRG
jgi:hypothetical protein